MATTFDMNDLKRRMQGAITSLKQELSGLRTGRASSALLDHVQVEAYGSHMPLNQLATISVPEPRLLNVQVWDRSQLHAVEKAISAANLGLSPTTEGQVLKLRIPELNEERRKEIVKVAQNTPRPREWRCATCAAMVSIFSRNRRRTTRSAKTSTLVSPARCKR